MLVTRRCSSGSARCRVVTRGAAPLRSWRPHVERGPVWSSVPGGVGWTTARQVTTFWSWTRSTTSGCSPVLPPWSTTGGAGTSGAAFAAGRPQVVCPFAVDQPFWARLAQQRGVAPTPVPQRHLTASRLATAITTATGDPGMARTAEQLGHRVRAEDGVSVAVTALERIALAHQQN